MARKTFIVVQLYTSAAYQAFFIIGNSSIKPNVTHWTFKLAWKFGYTKPIRGSEKDLYWSYYEEICKGMQCFRQKNHHTVWVQSKRGGEPKKIKNSNAAHISSPINLLTFTHCVKELSRIFLVQDQLKSNFVTCERTAIQMVTESRRWMRPFCGFCGLQASGYFVIIMLRVSFAGACAFWLWRCVRRCLPSQQHLTLWLTACLPAVTLELLLILTASLCTR